MAAGRGIAAINPSMPRIGRGHALVVSRGMVLYGARGLRILTALVLVLAGCLGNGGPAARGPGDGAPAPIKPTSRIEVNRGTATIDGLVADEELSPIDGAEVQVVRERNESVAPLALRTDAEGRFVAKGLEGGAYLVYAAKKGFREAPPKRVTVVEGESTFLRLVLERLPSPDPFHESKSWRFQNTIHRCVRVAGVTINCNIYAFIGSGPYVYTYVNDKLPDVSPMRTFVVELVWTDSDSFCRAGERIDVFSPDELAPQNPNNDGTNRSVHSPDHPYHWDNLPSVMSPIRVFIPRDGAGAWAMWSAKRTELNGGSRINLTGQWTVNVTTYPVNSLGNSPVFVSCITQRNLTLWATVFYVEPAAADWSIFAEDKR